MKLEVKKRYKKRNKRQMVNAGGYFTPQEVELFEQRYDLAIDLRYILYMEFTYPEEAKGIRSKNQDRRRR